jgi:hypothetical protein
MSDLPDFISYDQHSETITIHGVHYAEEMFRAFAFDCPGTMLRIINREDGAVTIERVPPTEHGNGA